MKKNIDLHMHTTISDGSMTPFEIIDEAIKNNLTTISITDHDTIDAYTDELINYANNKNIELIKGIEISTKTNKVGIHILGYNIDISNLVLKEELYKIRNSRHIYLHDVTKKLEELGYKVNIEKLDKIDSVTKAHISNDIINNFENRDLLLKTFNHIPNKGEFIETIMNENCPAYVKKISISPKKAVELIKQAGGIAVLAHPVAYSHEDNLSDDEILDIIKTSNIKGIEANYLYVDKYNNKYDECKKWNKFARDNNLFVTIGSDFHNKDGLRPEIGFINWPIKISDKEIDNIIKNISNKK